MSHEQNKGLLEALTNCAAECNHCASACLDEKDVQMAQKIIAEQNKEIKEFKNWLENNK